MELDILGKVNPCLIFRVYTLAGKSGIALHPQTIGLGAIMTGDGTTRQGLGENWEMIYKHGLTEVIILIH